MSLILLSNDSAEAKRLNCINSGIYKPYEFTNHMNTPVVIPPHSEIAVHSLKINKDPRFNINKSSNQFFLWYGEELSDDGLQVADCCSNPVMAWVSSVKKTSSNVNDFAKQIEDSLNGKIVSVNKYTGLAETGGFLYHPCIQGLAEVVPRRNAGDDKFEGFDFKFDQRTENTHGSLKGSFVPKSQNQWIGINTPDDDSSFVVTENGANAKITKKAGNTTCMMKHAPISLTGGKVIYKLTKITGGVNGGFRVGLSRSADKTHTHPAYCSDTGQGFFDYEIRTNVNDGDTIEVLHSVVDPNDKTMIKSRKVIYHGWDTGAGVCPANPLKISSDKITHLAFECKGETIKAQYSKDGGNTFISLVAYQQTLAGNGQKKVNYFKPINQCNWMMFGKIHMEKVDDEIEVTQYTGIPAQQPTNADVYYNKGLVGWEYRGKNKDWWATMQILNRENMYCRDIDTRLYNDIDIATEKASFKSVNASKGVAYNIVMILSQSNLYHRTIGANAMNSFGFEGDGVVDKPSLDGTKVVFASNQLPKIVDGGQSLFVRVNNFPYQSFNALKHTPSKILYHIPQFTNAGEEFGALYFEANEKCYLSLNNPQPIVMNEFNVDIVHKDERRASELVGDTCLVLHIRKKEK